MERRTKLRGSVLTECLLALPIALLAFAMLLWWAVRGIEASVSLYAVFMATRAASVATAPDDATLRARGQAAAIFPYVARRRLQGPWRLHYMDEQPRGAPQPQGDNPL